MRAPFFMSAAHLEVGSNNAAALPQMTQMLADATDEMRKPSAFRTFHTAASTRDNGWGKCNCSQNFHVPCSFIV